MKNKMLNLIMKGAILFAVGFSVGFIASYGEEYIQLLVTQPYIIFPYDLLYGILLTIIIIGYTLFYKNIKTYKSMGKNHLYDEDTSELMIDKAFYQIISLSSIIFIFTFIWFSLSIMQLNQVSNSIFVYVFMNFILSGIFLITSLVTQWYAFHLQNKKYPEKKLDLLSSKVNEAYFNMMDEGEKYETYKISYSVFNKMNVIFVVALVLLFTYGILFTFSAVTFLFVGLLWITMNGIYYFEGVKTYKI
ncbi:DUF3169 family protein [Oceanobacillus salinisoli]|uniref:DUF3169 family protein n=1 Tax=Oceanobacillus salinisoli TaxID=2678611 RepID=UPI0012E0FBCA|nr:DUF3169 family protein [Oceanobacillus salinisoli]